MHLDAKTALNYIQVFVCVRVLSSLLFFSFFVFLAFFCCSLPAGGRLDEIVSIVSPHYRSQTHTRAHLLTLRLSSPCCTPTPRQIDKFLYSSEDYIKAGAVLAVGIVSRWGGWTSIALLLLTSPPATTIPFSFFVLRRP